jgi:Uma2 family endonuclease
MSPAPIPKHQLFASNLSALFWNALRGCNECKAYQPIDYKISEDTILQPDLLVVCQPIEKNFLDFPPALIVEILSPSTASKDRLYKFNLYQLQQIPYYLIVDVEEESIEIYQLSANKYRLQQQGKDIKETFELDKDCRVTIDFATAWK